MLRMSHYLLIIFSKLLTKVPSDNVQRHRQSQRMTRKQKKHTSVDVSHVNVPTCRTAEVALGRPCC